MATHDAKIQARRALRSQERRKARKYTRDQMKFLAEQQSEQQVLSHRLRQQQVQQTVFTSPLADFTDTHHVDLDDDNSSPVVSSPVEEELVQHSQLPCTSDGEGNSPRDPIKQQPGKDDSNKATNPIPTYVANATPIPNPILLCSEEEISPSGKPAEDVELGHH